MNISEKYISWKSKFQQSDVDRLKICNRAHGEVVELTGGIVVGVGLVDTSETRLHFFHRFGGDIEKTFGVTSLVGLGNLTRSAETSK